MTRCHHTIDSPIGPLTLVAAAGELQEIHFPNTSIWSLPTRMATSGLVSLNTRAISAMAR